MIEAISRHDNPELSIALLERSLNVHITIHDLTGVFVHEGRRLLPLTRNSHQHPICKIPDRVRNPGSCIEHCYNSVHRDLLHSGGPACHNCWRGLREIAVPLMQHNSHVATIFAGAWRSGEVPPKVLKGEGLKIWKNLPPFPQGKAPQIAELLEILGRGLLADIQNIKQDDEEPRRKLIDEWLQAYCHENVKLSDLAKTLHISPSRCGHVIREIYSQTFPALLRSFRLRRARNLLAESNISAKTIAERVGMPAEAHFHRAFKEETGYTPRAWRLACHSNPGRKWPVENIIKN